MAFEAYGTLLQRGDGGGPETFTSIAELTSVSGPNLSMDTIDVTHMGSANAYREFIAGLKDGGDVSMDVNFLPADATQNMAAGIMADLDARTKRNFQVVWSDTAATVWSFSAFVTGFSPSSSLGDKLSATITLKITGKPTIA